MTSYWILKSSVDLISSTPCTSLVSQARKDEYQRWLGARRIAILRDGGDLWYNAASETNKIHAYGCGNSLCLLWLYDRDIIDQG